MRKLKKAYQYLYYKLYRFSESMAYPWWSEHKATLVVDVLLLFILTALLNYYKIFIDRYLDIFSLKNEAIFGLIFIGLLNSFLFNHKDKWKSIVAEFDQLPKKKNRMGSWLVLLFVCLIAANFIYSFYLVSQIDWNQYR